MKIYLKIPSIQVNMAITNNIRIFNMENNESIKAKEENFIEKNTTPVATNPESLQSEVEHFEIPIDQKSLSNEKDIEE